MIDAKFQRIDAKFPRKLAFLFEPMRYKVAYGGRGSGKSWSFARALLILGSTRKLRILCTREVQKSIKDSVHKLLADQVKNLGLGPFYDIQVAKIVGVNGTEIFFSGLADQTAESIKSFEKIDICWCEEAQSISEKSWSILIPTIRADDSEIWVTYNPDLETDATHKRFVTNPPSNCISVLLNYCDNVFFPAVLEQERLDCFRKSFDSKHEYNQYLDLSSRLDGLGKEELDRLSKLNQKLYQYKNTWEGACMPASSGSIYFNEVASAENNGQVCNVQYDPLLKVHVVFDLGWNDAMSIALVQRSGSGEIRVIDYIEDSHKTLSDYSIILRENKYNWGQVWLPHDGRAKDYKSGKSSEEILRALGWDVRITSSISIEDGIKAARMMFKRTYFDKVKTKRLVECLKRYKRTINNATNEAGSPCHDEFSHGADCYRYIAVNADLLQNASFNDDYDDYDNDNTGRSAASGY